MVGEDRKEKVKLLEGALDRLTFYINPEIYHSEKEYLRTGKLPGKGTENIEFKQHSETAQRYGKPVVSTLMRDAIAEIYDKNRKKGPTLRLMGDKGVVTGIINNDENVKPSQIIPPKEDDEDCLG